MGEERGKMILYGFKGKDNCHDIDLHIYIYTYTLNYIGKAIHCCQMPQHLGSSMWLRILMSPLM